MKKNNLKSIQKYKQLHNMTRVLISLFHVHVKKCKFSFFFYSFIQSEGSTKEFNIFFWEGGFHNLTKR